MGEVHKLVAGALAGGIALGVWAIAEGAGKETVQGSVKERHLKSIALTLHVLYDARLTTNVSAQVTVHDKNPLPFLAKLPIFRDLRNHTLRDTADVIVNVGSKLESLQATPDPRTRAASPNRPTRLARAIGVIPDRTLPAHDQSGAVGSHLGLPAASRAAERVGRCCDSRGRGWANAPGPPFNPPTHAAATRATPRAAKANRVAAFRGKGLNVEV